MPTSAQAYAISMWHQDRADDGTTLLVVDSIRKQEEIASDLEAWGSKVLFIPEVESFSQESSIDPDLLSERLAVLKELANSGKKLVLVTEKALRQSVPSLATISRSALSIRSQENIEMEDLKEKLLHCGYIQEHQVATRGQFSQRGGILDVFSWDSDYPVRFEWFGSEVDSIRYFNPEDQLTFKPTDFASVLLIDPSSEHEQNTSLGKFIGAIYKTMYLSDSEEKEMEPLALADQFFAHDFLQRPVADQVLQENRKQLLLEYLEDWLCEDWEVWVGCRNEGEEQRLIEWLHESQTKGYLAQALEHQDKKLRFFRSPLLRGFGWPEGKLIVLTDAEIFGRYQTLRSLRKKELLNRVKRRQQQIEFTELSDGDYVVHMEYGIALYGGIEEMPNERGRNRQVVVLIFAEGARLYVPVEQSFLISKYVGVGKKHPVLDSLGGNRWDRSKKRAEKAIMDYAASLLKLHAERETLEGFPFPVDSEWQHEFENAFLYEETPDQLAAIEATKMDMESKQPMDRLICGDVGFGKTEVAIRAAFKAVMGGKQVAFLAPTTVLAQQHYQTLLERMADYPITIGCLSRFRSRAEQRATVKDLASGKVDIVVGTHRLTSKDVSYKNLGLVIVDEEQRFGVKQKEKFKEMFRLIDVLTLSATPIPRTLYLSLMGARDMSTIETAPPNRLSVETTITGYDEPLIRKVILRELAREGQVYFLHNRVKTIESMAKKIELLAPDCRVLVGHGQMDEKQLEDVMNQFVQGEADVLVATTIIESGIDIPNANTIIIDRADRFGLADLYQLRGRVGRGQNRAYALLLLPRDLVKGDAGKRVQAIRQYTQLGSGYKIAMRDLEIRGAGNLLGTAQSGHIIAIGFDLYCKLLRKAVAVLKGEARAETQEMSLSLDFIAMGEESAEIAQQQARLTQGYMSDIKWRMEGYRDLAELDSVQQWLDLREKWKDRFGRWPEEVECLLQVYKIKVLGQEAGFTRLEAKGEKLMVRKGADFVMIDNKFPRLTKVKPKDKLKEVEKWIKSLALR